MEIEAPRGGRGFTGAVSGTARDNGSGGGEVFSGPQRKSVGWSLSRQVLLVGVGDENPGAVFADGVGGGSAEGCAVLRLYFCPGTWERM